MHIWEYEKARRQLNPEMSEDDAWNIAYEDFNNYKELRRDGYNDTQALQLMGAMRLGII